MKNIFLSLLFTVCIVKVYSQPVNTNISNSAYFGGEPYLAINPQNSNNIVIAWMALDFSTNFKVSIKSKTSFDGGLTWGNPFVQPHFMSNWGSADVSMGFRNNGTLYLSYIDYKSNSDSGGVYLTHSVNGGVSWSAPTRAWDAHTEDPGEVPLDRPWIAIDNSGTNNDGMFYMTTKPAPWIPAPNRAYLKTSSDSGQTWSNFRYIDTTNYLIGSGIQQPMTALCTTSDGVLGLAYPSYVATQSVYPKFYFAKSYNKGLSFQRYDLLVNPTAVNNSLYKLGYTLTANPLNSTQMAFCFVSGQNGDPDIYVTTTNNGGLNWSTPVRANDDALSNGKAQDLCWISYSKDNKLLAVWRDKRNGAGTGFYQPSDIYCAVSTNNGTSFQSNIKLTNVSANHDTILSQNGNDFLGCALLNDTIYATWGDVRTGVLNIYFTKTSINSGVGIKPVLINEEEVSLIVYPNPNSGNFTFKASKEGVYALYNELGQLIKAFPLTGNNNLTANVEGLKPGIYFIECKNCKKPLKQRVLVVK